MNQIVLLSKRLVIRLYDDSDLENVYKYRKLDAVSDFYSIKLNTIDELKYYLKETITEHGSKNYYSLFVIEKDKNVIGDLAIKCWEYENKVGAIGYAIDPEYQKMGYASEAVETLLVYLFEEMKMQRVQAYVDPDNIASIRVLEKVGMKKEAHFRECEYKNGEWKDEITYGMIMRDRKK